MFLSKEKWVRSQHYALLRDAPIQTRTSLSDIIAHNKVVVTAFLYENILALNLAPKLIEPAKNLASDMLALSKLKMSRIAATYISTYGTAKCMGKELMQQLKGIVFSLNIDEVTNNSVGKILNMMVCFYNIE